MCILYPWLFIALLGKDSGGRDEVLRSLGAVGLTAIATFFVIAWLRGKGMTMQALSILVTATFLGGYYILIILAFGAECIF